MPVTCTPGGAADNSYISLSDANGYFADTLREDTWLGFPAAQRERALVQATSQIERLGGSKHTTTAERYRFFGSPETTTQALHFPRAGDVDADGSSCIPAGVQEAVCEQALWLLQQQANPQLVDHLELQSQGVQSATIDGLGFSYRGLSGVPVGIALLAWRAIKPFINRTIRTRV